LCDELDIITHAFKEEDIVLFELDELVLGLMKRKSVSGVAAGACVGTGVGAAGAIFC
jgi:hypothetical protein